MKAKNDALLLANLLPAFALMCLISVCALCETSESAKQVRRYDVDVVTKGARSTLTKAGPPPSKQRLRTAPLSVALIGIKAS